MRPDGPRDTLAGPDSGPESPFPVKIQGPVIKGFGRGSKELGVPTANIPTDGLPSHPELPSGVYYGFVGLKTSDASISIYPSVLSIGYNPVYKNTTRSIEVHILHEFHDDFYGASLNLSILGYIRPEYDYASLEALIDDIKRDCAVARKSLDREAYQKLQHDEWLKDFGWASKVDAKAKEAEVLGQSNL